MLQTVFNLRYLIPSQNFIKSSGQTDSKTVIGNQIWPIFDGEKTFLPRPTVYVYVHHSIKELFYYNY